MRKDIQYIDDNDNQNTIYSAKKAKVRSKYEFVENEDFKLDLPNLANQKSHGGDRKTKYYSLTLDMAKELSMVEVWILGL